MINTNRCKNSISLVFHHLVVVTFVAACNAPVKQESPRKQVQQVSAKEVYIPEVDSVWAKPDFDSAVAVILNGSHDILSDITRMDSRYSLNSRRKLNDTQLKSITDYLSGRKISPDSGAADCFQPYHGFYFYKDGKIAGRLAICFSCSNYFSQPRERGRLNLKEIKAMFTGWNLPVYNWDDPEESEKAKVKYSDFFTKSITRKYLIPDDYPVTDSILKENYGQKKRGKVFSIDNVWFANDTLQESLVFELYTDFHRSNSFHFRYKDIPEQLIEAMSLHVLSNGSNSSFDPATLNQKKESFREFIVSAKRISSSYFKNHGAIKLEADQESVFYIYGKPHKLTVSKGIEMCEWSYVGDKNEQNIELRHLIASSGLVAWNSYGYKQTLFFKNKKLIAMILSNDIP